MNRVVVKTDISPPAESEDNQSDRQNSTLLEFCVATRRCDTAPVSLAESLVFICWPVAFSLHGEGCPPYTGNNRYRPISPGIIDTMISNGPPHIGSALPF